MVVGAPLSQFLGVSLCCPSQPPACVFLVPSLVPYRTPSPLPYGEYVRRGMNGASGRKTTVTRHLACKRVIRSSLVAWQRTLQGPADVFARQRALHSSEDNVDVSRNTFVRQTTFDSQRILAISHEAVALILNTSANAYAS